MIEAKETIQGTLKRLNASITTKVPIIVNSQIKQVRDLLKLLEEERLITIIKTHATSKVVKIAKEVTKI